MLGRRSASQSVLTSMSYDRLKTTTSDIDLNAKDSDEALSTSSSSGDLKTMYSNNGGVHNAASSNTNLNSKDSCETCSSNNGTAMSNMQLTGNPSSLQTLFSSYEPVCAGCLYCIMSMSMVLMNKHVLSNFEYSCTNSILLLQNIVSVLFVVLGNITNLIQTEPMRMDIVKLWLPVNLIFVGMIWTGFFSLKYLGVAMVTVLKNFTNVIIVFGDKFLFGREHTSGVWLTIVLLFASVICGGSTDVQFSVVGYTWQFLNCCFTASYSLFLRGVMDNVKLIVKNPRGLDEFSMVLYNNILSIPFVLLLMLQGGEIPKVFEEIQRQPVAFYIVAGLSGVLGFGISIASLWYLSRTSATTYSITGSLNKIPTVIFGYLFFATETSVWNLLSVAFGLGAGLMFTYAKIQESQQMKCQQQQGPTNKI